MKIERVTYCALVALLSAASCTKEAAEPDVYKWSEGEIYFRTSLSDVASSRAQDMTLDYLESFQVTCFNTGDIAKDADGFVSPYFENATFIRKTGVAAGTAFVSSPDEGPRDWPTKEGVLRFFAFSPSLELMAAGNSGISNAGRDNFFNLTNSSCETGSSVAIGYRLGKVRVKPDISRQFDFITAEASGERWKDFVSGIDLAFRHQMSQVELRAWGASTSYDFEIAGVRLGNPVVEGTFVFSDDANPASSGKWMDKEDAVKDKVEYLYRSPDASADGDDLLKGDRIFRINHAEHNTLESAESIMGRGGCAMVIPTLNPKWKGLADPNIATVPYSTERMYFSILLRVTDSDSGKLLYPYSGNPSGMSVVYYAVASDGKIISRLYPGHSDGEFFTDRDLSKPYSAAEGETVKDFGWAAVPVDADWGAGQRYVYTLNYSEGIGVHDPADPEPGKPIIDKTAISWGIHVSTWDYAEKNEDYNPNMNVP